MGYHFLFKGLALILAALLLVLLFAAMILVLDMHYMGLYDQGLEPVLEQNAMEKARYLGTRALNDYLRDYVSDCPESYAVMLDATTGKTLNLWEQALKTVGIDSIYCGYEILDENREPLAQVLPGDVAGVTPYFLQLSGGYNQLCSQEECSYGLVVDGKEIYIRWVESRTYSVVVYLLSSKLPYAEGYPVGFLFLAYENRYALILSGVAIALLLVGLTTYLCCAAGHKPGRKELRAGGLNRAPFDAYLAAAGFLFVAAMVFATELSPLYDLSYVPYSEKMGMRDFSPLEYLVCGGLCYGAFLLFFMVVFAFAAQVKTPGWFLVKNSLIGRVLWLLYKLVRLTVRGIGRVFSLLPVIWQWLLAGLYLLLCMGIAVLAESEFLLALSLMQMIGATVYGAVCFGQLYKTARELSQGTLQQPKSKGAMLGAFRDFAYRLEHISQAAASAAESQVRAERMKTELITNVSHDIKTPLTSIINYVDLLKTEEEPEARQEYLQVLDRQSLRLKKLIDDLMELSKASSGNIRPQLTLMDAREALNQALGEFSDKLEGANLTLCTDLPEEAVFIDGDGRLFWRVISNLMSNTVKYALPGTRVYVTLQELEDRAVISVKNISREPLNISARELMERFVRGDAARNTEGSGLGLSIAQELMAAQGGRLELSIDGDLFKAEMVFFTDRQTEQQTQ